MGRIAVVIAIVAVIIAGLVIASGQIVISVNREGTQVVTIDSGAAQAIDLLVDIHAGDLSVSSGAATAMEGDFRFRDPAFSAEVDSSLDAERGTINVVQPAGASNAADYNFEIALNDETPIQLDVRTENGSANLNLDDLWVERLNAGLGGGADNLSMIVAEGTESPLTSAIFNLGQGDDQSVFRGTFGQLTTLVAGLATGGDQLTVEGTYPVLTSASIDGDTGGDFVVWRGDFAALRSLTINLGAGSDQLTLAGAFPQMQSMLINVGVGDDRVDLANEWANSVDITLISESDSSYLVLPSTVGVEVNVLSDPQTVNLTGMTETEDGRFVNAARETSEVVLSITMITTALDNVTLEVAGS